MNTSLEKHIHRLRQHYGSYSQAARAMGIDPRTFRRGRNDTMPKLAARLVITSGKLLALRLFLRELLAAGDVSTVAARRAWRKSKGLGA